MQTNTFGIKGLTQSEVEASRASNGTNEIEIRRDSDVYIILVGLLKEPMVILLLVTAILYYITGNTGDAIFLTCAIIFVAGISFYQDYRSKTALEKLKILTQPNCDVIRNSKRISIKQKDIVLGDYLVVDEGSIVAADAEIVHSHDFSVNESILTGESMSVFKNKSTPDKEIYMGTMVASGLAVAKVNRIAGDTNWGKIRKSIEEIVEEKSPLEIQINAFVKKMVIAGSVIFSFVWFLNYLDSNELIDSLIKALTLAMSILPEEIPVAFTTFMALGAWRLMKMGVIVKQIKTVETLGSATVICIDKTGTITKNEMALQKVFSPKSKKFTSPEAPLDQTELHLLTTAMWASEPLPFDPMEKAIHTLYAKNAPVDVRKEYEMIHEYPLDGKPPMMTHIYKHKQNGNIIISAKGAPEAILKVSDMNSQLEDQLNQAIYQLTSRGYRVLGVGEAFTDDEDFPQKQQNIVFNFLGLLAFYDPPKDNISKVLNSFDEAGINVKIITGDNAETTQAIAHEIGFNGQDQSLSGEELMKISEADLPKIAQSKKIFSRMFPEAKLRIINALKSSNEVVAMTGDGVNDAPALKASHIGIAMGKKGTEIAKDAASLILANDDLALMVDAVAIGRKIYNNLKKAIRYIISIHIPIILTVFIPLVLGWIYPTILSPVHVILLELIMGPTCSIIYENEPIESTVMEEPPRPFTRTFFKWSELSVSIVQGIMISIGVLLIYQISVHWGGSEKQTRAMVFTTLISSNIILTLVNRSFYQSIWHTFKYKNPLVPLIIAITSIILLSLLTIDPLIDFFQFEAISLQKIIICILMGTVFVLWFEIIKWHKRKQTA